jgi:hypothetical protein
MAARGKLLCCARPPPQTVHTGIVLAVRGRAEPGGDFVVSDVLWPGLAPQPERPLMDTDKYVALVSGLQLADRKADMMQVRAGARTGAGGGGAGAETTLRWCQWAAAGRTKADIMCG